VSIVVLEGEAKRGGVEEEEEEEKELLEKGGDSGQIKFATAREHSA
jgi:hypothetical protein